MQAAMQWTMILAIGLAMAAAQAPEKTSAAASSVSEPGFKIGGRVVDVQNGSPVAHAQVSVAPVTAREDLRTTDSDDNGAFLFTGLPAGKYALNVQRRGYVTQAYLQHDVHSTSIAVGPGLESENIVFPLGREAAITGHVTDDFGEAVRDARVMLFQAGLQAGQRAVFSRGAAVTNDLGMYHFGHLPPGQYYVAVMTSPWYAHSVPGAIGFISSPPVTADNSVRFNPPQQEKNPALDVAFPVTFYPSATASGDATRISPAPGERFVADISLRAVASLHLRVPVNAGGHDAEDNRNVRVRQQLFDGVVVPVQAAGQKAGDTAMAVAGLAPGHYIVDVISSGEGGPVSTQSLEIDALSDGEVGAGKEREMTPVSGSVKPEAGSKAPLPNAVLLREKKTEMRYIARVAPNGDFDFRQPIPAGDYVLDVADARGTTVKRISATTPARDETPHGETVRGQSVKINGKAPINLTVELTDALGRIEGVVLRENKPAAAVLVLLVPQDPADNPSLFRRDQSDSDGTFTLGSVLPGKYTLVAIEKGWDLEWTRPEVLKPYLRYGEAVSVEPRGVQQIKIQAQPISQ